MPGLADVDLDAPVARLVDLVLGADQGLALAAPGGGDAPGRNADLDEKPLHRLGALRREAVVGEQFANGIGVADDLHIG